MPHIHENGNDFVTDVYIVYGNKVLLRKHDKNGMWLAPGGHVELNETPDEAAVREAKEEVGLDVELWDNETAAFPSDEKNRRVLPPVHMDMHKINDHHNHISHVYFARTRSDKTIDEGREKSGGLKWCSREEVEAMIELLPRIRAYALHALEVLSEKTHA
jgi:8-oxo-dGTP pyrophosphatase MutT (NUDIX family)